MQRCCEAACSGFDVWLARFVAHYCEPDTLRGSHRQFLPRPHFFFSCSFARGLEFRIWVLSSPSPPNISSSVNALFCRKWDRCLTISQSVHVDILCLLSPLFLFFFSNAGGKFCNMQITDAVTLKCTGQLVVDESICEFVVQLKVLQSCALT